MAKANLESTSRRALVKGAGIAAVAAATLPIAAMGSVRAAEPDPIFGLIERERAARRALHQCYAQVEPEACVHG